ncbi:hypothetical protein PSAC2689_200009 [Paraburkholderia sacchari]
MLIDAREADLLAWARSERKKVTPDGWCGLSTAALMFGVSPSTLRRWCDEGLPPEIRTRDVKDRTQFHVRSVAVYLIHAELSAENS